jgi:hypothetical protein
MGAPIDMTGMKFGRLTALRVTRYRGVRAWVFRCDCGKEKIRPTNDVRMGRTKSCGCLHAEMAAINSSRTRRLGPGVARFHQVLKSYTDRARRDGLPWELSKAQARSLMERDCHYCGAPPSNVNRAPYGRWGEFIWNGIDRGNSFRGYTPGNCVPCCSKCNYMKSDLGVLQFLQHVRRITEWQQRKARRSAR